MNQKELEKELLALKKRVAKLESAKLPQEEPEPEPEPEMAPAPKPRRKHKETNPQTVFAWVGGIIFALGIIFLVSYAFDQGWISRSLQVILGVLVGLVIAGIGHGLHRKLPLQGSLVSGAGAAVAYFSIYVGYAAEAYRSELGLSLGAATFFLLIVLFGAVWLAAKQNSIVLLLETFILAQITSLLGAINYLTIIYLLLIAVGYVVFIQLKHWENMGWYGGGIAAFFALITILRATYAQSMVLIAGLTLLFSVLSYLRKNELGATLTIVGGYALGLLAHAQQESYVATYTLIFAIVAAIIHGLWFTRSNKAVGPMLAAIGLFVIWVPMELDGFAITMSWAILAAILAVLGAIKDKQIYRIAGTVLLSLTAARLLLLDSWTLGGAERLGAFIIAAIVLLAVGELYRHKKAPEHVVMHVLGVLALIVIVYIQAPVEREVLYLSAIGLAGSLVAIRTNDLGQRYTSLAVYALALFTAAVLLQAFAESTTLKVISMLVLSAVLFVTSYQYAVREWFEAHLAYIGGIVTLVILIAAELDRIWITILWAFIGALSLVLGEMTDRPVPKNSGYVLVALAVLKLFLVDTLSLEPGLRIIAYVVLGVLLLVVSVGFSRRKKKNS